MHVRHLQAMGGITAELISRPLWRDLGWDSGPFSIMPTKLSRVQDGNFYRPTSGDLPLDVEPVETGSRSTEHVGPGG